MNQKEQDHRELRPLGEAVPTSDPALEEQNRFNRTSRQGDQTPTTESGCRSCGAPIPSNRTKCLFCLDEHIEPTDEGTAASSEDLLGVFFIAVSARTEYEAVAKGAVACRKLVSDTGPIDGYQLVDDIDEPAPQLVERWTSLPAATSLNSEPGQQLLERLVDVLNEYFSRWSPAHRGFPILYDEWGHALENVTELKESRQWLVPALALHEQPKLDHSTKDGLSIPTKTQLFCRHCEEETIHVFESRDTSPESSVPATPVWECHRCQRPRHGPEPK